MKFVLVVGHTDRWEWDDELSYLKLVLVVIMSVWQTDRWEWDDELSYLKLVLVVIVSVWQTDRWEWDDDCRTWSLSWWLLWVSDRQTGENETTSYRTWSLSSWLLWVSDRCLNSCIIRIQWPTFSGETKSSAILMQLWRFLTWQSHTYTAR